MPDRVEPGPVDWAAAVRAGRRLAPTGPAVSPDEAAGAVADLRAFSRRAELVVRDTTALGHGLPVDDAEVVDRPGWIAATAEGMERLTGPAVARLAAATGGRAAGRVTRSAAGQQVGLILGFLSGKVLGQYDPLGGDPRRPGRLLLVAPNIVKVERELAADPTDFRLWVCLHESTHRLQFTAVPWLRDHFTSLVAEFADKADPDPARMLQRAAAAIKGETTGEPGRPSWIEGIQSPEQRAVFDRVMALMSLLEGHADHVMDAVGPAVVPSVTSIRASFTERRRKGAGPIDRLIRALLGMEMKLAQYVNGGAFVREAVATVGMAGFNAVWQSPDTLPTRAEIADPAAWVRRVHG
ncbi:zinc-dependent metalloprotease [Nakamurella sp.]|uniref:zinc-dependent metalloprotease n=1 Tax=Nakamurella sp. TaxID=1869182 RepID=UPI003B3B2573